MVSGNAGRCEDISKQPERLETTQTFISDGLSRHCHQLRGCHGGVNFGRIHAHTFNAVANDSLLQYFHVLRDFVHDLTPNKALSRKLNNATRTIEYPCRFNFAD